MGCAECKLVKLLRRKESVRELVGVDIQASLLEPQQRNLQPLISDFILPRSSPLTIHLMQGILYLSLTPHSLSPWYRVHC